MAPPAYEENFHTIAIGEQQWRDVKVGAIHRKWLKYMMIYLIESSAIMCAAGIKSIDPSPDEEKKKKHKWALPFDGPAH